MEDGRSVTALLPFFAFRFSLFVALPALRALDGRAIIASHTEARGARSAEGATDGELEPYPLRVSRDLRHIDCAPNDGREIDRLKIQHQFSRHDA